MRQLPARNRDTRPENPLLRKYNLADREQNVLELALDLRPRENVDVGVSVELRDDDYSDSALGLQSATPGDL